MDKELLKKFHLEEAQKRFQQISEYTFITKPMLSEDGEEDDTQGHKQQPQQGQEGMLPQQQPPMPQGNGEAQQSDGNNMQQPPVAPPNNMSQGNWEMPPSNDGGDEQMDVDFEPQNDDNVDSMQDGDEVIDVDELTNAQKTAEVKIDGVNDKLQDLLNVTTKFIAAVDQNNKKIDDLRAEFEKRNPSEEEKINIRSQASAPYSETPKSFWDKKSENSNYNVIYNNDVDPDKEEKEYVIRQSDVNSNDDRSLAKSLDYPSKLRDFIDF